MARPRLRTPVRVDVGVIASPIAAPEPTPDPQSDAGVRRRVAIVREIYRDVQATEFWIGEELLKLKRERAQRLFGRKTFQQLVTLEMKIPYRTAARYMRVARHFPAHVAVGMGIAKCEQMIRLHEALDDKRKYGRNPMVMLRRNPRFGKTSKPLRRMQAKEIEALVRAITLRQAAETLPAPTALQRRMLDRLRGAFEVMGRPARTRFHPGRNEFTAVFGYDEVRQHFR